MFSLEDARHPFITNAIPNLANFSCVNDDRLNRWTLHLKQIPTGLDSSPVLVPQNFVNNYNFYLQTKINVEKLLKHGRQTGYIIKGGKITMEPAELVW